MKYSLLPYVQGSNQLPILTDSFCAIIDKSCRSSIEASELGVRSMHPFAVLVMRLLYCELDPNSDLLRNVLEESPGLVSPALSLGRGG